MTAVDSPRAAAAEPRYVRVHRATVIWRLIHWSNVASIAVCCITGIFIAHPFYVASVPMLMDWNRALHLYGAMVLDMSTMAIAYLYFFSRSERHTDELIPTRGNLVRLQEAFLNVAMLNRRKRFDSSRPDPLNGLFFVLFHAMIVFQVLTGLQLYVEGLTANMSSVGAWWPVLCHFLTNWMLPVFGGPAGVRWWHALLLYPIVAWVFLHIYYEIWRSLMWKEGDIGIMFTGFKFTQQQGAGSPAAGPQPAESDGRGA